DWSSDVCSSDLIRTLEVRPSGPCQAREAEHRNQAFHPVTPHEHYVSSPTWMNRKPEAFQTSHGRPLRPFPRRPRIPNAVMIYQAAINESFPVADPPTHAARLR